MEHGALPEHIGPYRVTGRLGQGGMGEVLRGHDDRLDRPVALKRIRSGDKDPEKARQRFRREARVAARLSHQAVVQVYDWVETEDQDWLVMELVDGRPLDDLLADGPLPPKRAAAITREVASGLAAAHEAGLVHRDLKAANVMVTADGDLTQITPGRVKILDFGIAKQVETETVDARKGDPLPTLTEAGQILGTVTSMSPEQALGYPVDHRSDLFSLGTLLYEMLSGVSPFEGNSKVETLSRICSARETPLRDLDTRLPPGLAGLVGRLLEKEPARRPARANEVVAELDRLTKTSSTVDFTPSATTAEPGVAGPHDATLEMGALEAAPLPASADSEDFQSATGDHSGTYTAARISRWWGVPLAAACVLVAIGLWGLASWPGSLTGDATNVTTPSGATPPPGEEINSYELYQRGMTLLERYDRKGNIGKAIADFQRALALDENSAPALAGLARAYWLDFFVGSLDRQRLEQALVAASRAAELDEYLAIARSSLGMVYFELGRPEEAAKELELALQLEPLNAEARFGLSRLYDSQGKLPEAEEQIRQAMKAQSGAWHYGAWLGTLQLKTGRYEAALEAFQHSLELAPDNFLSFRNLGVAYYLQGRLAEAATEFQNALKIRPDPSLYTNLGNIYFTQGLYPQSVAAFEKAVKTGGGANAYFLVGKFGRRVPLDARQ